ncbi:MAG: sulfatase-like hydrolase/transferase [Acidobacteria bacterium]|nr:sulfatase-like hydrolase/transferase [Acidobacteriota bacterium]
MMNRRAFLSASLAVRAAQQRSRPNILVFMTDQESALLPGPAALPNRARIAKGAADFTRAFCNTPQCSPARSSLMTGLEPHHTGVRTNVDGGSLGASLDASIPTVGSVFRAAGWATGYFGKWHLSRETAGGLERFGFSSGAGGTDAEAAAAASAWIRQRKGPWLAWVSVLNPHDIYHIREVLERTAIRPGVKPPATGLANLSAKPSEQREFVEKDQGKITADFDANHWLRYRSYYLNLLEQTDVQLGQVLDAAGDLADTIVVYTADHGDQLGGHGLPFKGPFMYEPLIRIPLLIRAPGRMQPGRRDDLVTQADIAPTLAALAGVEWPRKIDGESLVKEISRDAIFLEYYAKQKWVNPIRTVRTKRWKLNLYESGNRELYDLVADPYEGKDLSKTPEHKHTMAALELRINRWWPR